MNKINFVNKAFFKNNKRFIFAIGSLGGFLVVNLVGYRISDSRYLSYTAKVKSSRELDYCSCDYEPGDIETQILDKIIWDEEYENKEAKVFCPSYLTTNDVQVIVFRGSSFVTHYRVEFQDSIFSDHVLEWNKLPDDDIIHFRLEDIPEKNRYGAYLSIQFGTYNSKSNTILENNSEFCFQTVGSKEEMQEHEKVHERIRTIANRIVSEDETDFEKTKRIYDFLIDYAEYRYSEKGIYEQAPFNKYYMDCVGYAEFMNLALNSVGVECFSVHDNTHGHVWNMVKIDDKYYHLDATYSDTSSWCDTSRYRYFLVSDEFMLADHRFFVSEKNRVCNDIYDLTGIVSEKDVEHRGFRGEQISQITDGHKIGEIIDSGYSLKYRIR